MYAYASLSQDGSYCKGIWVEHPLTLLPIVLQGAFSANAWWGRSPDFGNERHVVWGGPSLLP